MAPLARSIGCKPSTPKSEDDWKTSNEEESENLNKSKERKLNILLFLFPANLAHVLWDASLLADRWSLGAKIVKSFCYIFSALLQSSSSPLYLGFPIYEYDWWQLINYVIIASRRCADLLNLLLANILRHVLANLIRIKMLTMIDISVMIRMLVMMMSMMLMGNR